MGLDTTHNAWHGAYSSFGTFRKKLAEQIGINLNDYWGYSGGGKLDLRSIDHDIQPLLDHSDCDGELTVSDCERIANGLNDILERIKDKPVIDHQQFTEDIIQFRNGCLDAVSKGESIKFH